MSLSGEESAADEVGRRHHVSMPSMLSKLPRPLLSRRSEKRQSETVGSEVYVNTPLAKKRRAADDIPASAEKAKSSKSAPRAVFASASCPSKPSQRSTTSKFEGAVERAVQMYEDAWAQFLTERYWHGSDRACELAEAHASEVYEKACEAVADVLPWAQAKRCKVPRPGGYIALQFLGSQNDDELTLREELEKFRLAGKQGLARDALCALFSVLSARREKTWLDGVEMEERLKNKLKWKRGKQEKLRGSIADFISRKIRGEFSRTLVDPGAIYRVAFSSNESRLRPASIIISYQCPLKEALESMDSSGPMEERPFKWFAKASRQFALQTITTGLGLDHDFSREHVVNLTPDATLKEMLASRKDAVFLDALAALAPRRQAKEHGLSKIVQFELVTLLREAKAKGQAAVFMLGGKESHKLAEKVYLQPPFTDNGLRCGYLRWRESAHHPWAREKLSWGDRICIGLQLP